jgi:hypothetical protein
MIKNVLFLIFFSLFSLIASEPDIQILSQSSNSFQLKIVFPEPQLIKTDSKIKNQLSTYIHTDGLSLLKEEGYPRVPYLTKMFSLPSNKVSYRIIDIKKENISVTNYLFNVSSLQILDNSNSKIIKNKDIIDISNHGLFREVPIFTLNIFPVRLDNTGKNAEVLRSITIEITSTFAKEKTQIKSGNYPLKEKSVLKKLLINGDRVTYKVDQSLSKSIITNQRYQSGRYKLLVNKTGLYKITYADLIAAEVPLEQFDTRKLHLTNRGQEIPVYFKGGEDGIFDPGDYFEFWATKNEKTFFYKYPDVYSDPYTNITVYWLGEGNISGLRLAEESGALTITDDRQYIIPKYFTEKLHIEQNNAFHSFGKANIDSLSYTMDHWFFDRGVIAIGSKTYNAFIPWPYTASIGPSVYIKTVMRGLSFKSKNNPLLNHQVEIWLNDRRAASSGSWQDQNLHILTNENDIGLSQTDISHGENQFRIVMDQTGVTDITLLNWFEITYQRMYRAYQNEIKFKKQDNLPENFIIQFEIDGFDGPDIDLYKVGVSKIVNNRINYVTADDELSSYQIAFQDTIFYPNIEYIAVTEDRKKKPLDIVVDTPWLSDEEQSSLLNLSNSADYLIITDDLFYQNCLQLKSYREGFGLQVEVVRVEDIYDEFNYGIKSPLAIKDFLKYAFDNWDPNHRLLYVNLVGDASFDYKNGDYVPTFLFETVDYGAAASDFQYALISGDDSTPDLIVGRIPVSNNSEFEAYFDKLKAYEDPSNIGDWRNRGLFISGNDANTMEQFTGLPAFRTQNQRLINMKAPEGYFTRKLNTVEDTTIQGGDPNFGSTPTLLDYFDDGLALINFFGHGGGGIWADVGLFNSSDIERLNNGSRLPFIKSMTCFTGAFESASINGIAEQLIVTPEKGAIGVLAASGVGWLHNDFALGWTLTEFLLNQGLTVGEAVLYTKIFYLNNNVYVTELFDSTIPSYFSLELSMANHYNLLGDPYVSIAVPQNNLKVSVDNTIPAIGDTVHIVIETPFSSGSGRIELCNENHEPLEEKFLDINNFRSEVEFSIPPELETQLAYIKAYAINFSGDQDGRGVANLAINKALLDSIIVSPRNPIIGDELFFSAYITSPIALQRVRIKNLKGPTGEYHTFDLQEVNNTLWTSTSAFGPFLFSDTVYFDILMDDTAGVSYLSRRNKLIIKDPRPDLRVANNGLSFGGTEQIELDLMVENNSDSTISQITIEFYVDSLGSGTEPIHFEKIILEANQKKTISFVIDQALVQPALPFRIVIDRENTIKERNEENNIQTVNFPGNLFNLPQTIGTTHDGLQNDTLNLNHFTRFRLPPQGLTASSVLSFRTKTNNELLSLEEQPGLSYVNFFGMTEPISILLEFENTAAVQTKNAFLEFKVDTSLYETFSLQNVSICRFVSNLNRWLAINTEVSGDKISASLNQPGEYALFQVEDVKKPVIEITVNGRILHDNMLVPLNPSLAFILQDENGVDLTSGFNIYIDDQKLSGEELNVPDSVQNANSIALIAKPQLSAGNHTLRTEVADAFGNTLDKTLSFRVAGSFDLQIYGNYPNPFEESTVISFLILANNVLDNFSLKIYTVAGRQIREIKNPQGSDEIWDPGYHEIEWDGRDQDGRLVANGVYFALIRAKLADKSFEETLKIAKLK